MWLNKKSCELYDLQSGLSQSKNETNNLCFVFLYKQHFKMNLAYLAGKTASCSSPALVPVDTLSQTQSTRKSECYW